MAQTLKSLTADVRILKGGIRKEYKKAKPNLRRIDEMGQNLKRKEQSLKAMQ